MGKAPERFHVEWTDEHRGKLTIGGHLLPYESLRIEHDPSSLPVLTVSLPVVDGQVVTLDAAVAVVCEKTREALIAMGWTPPAEAEPEFTAGEAVPFKPTSQVVGPQPTAREQIEDPVPPLLRAQ